MDRKEMQNTRLYLLAALLLLALVIYLFVLYDVQVIHHDDYAARAVRRTSGPRTWAWPRGTSP